MENLKKIIVTNKINAYKYLIMPSNFYMTKILKIIISYDIKKIMNKL